MGRQGWAVSDEVKSKILILMQQGIPVRRLAERYGVSKSFISSLARKNGIKVGQGRGQRV